MYFIMRGCLPHYMVFTPTSSQWLRNAIDPKDKDLLYVIAAYELKARGKWYIKSPQAP